MNPEDPIEETEMEFWCKALQNECEEKDERISKLEVEVERLKSIIRQREATCSLKEDTINNLTNDLKNLN